MKSIPNETHYFPFTVFVLYFRFLFPMQWEYRACGRESGFTRQSRGGIMTEKKK